MDGSRFDELARLLASGQSRRGFLKTLGATALGGLGLVGARDVVAGEKKIWICHSTCSDTNPYNLLHISISGLNGHCQGPVAPDGTCSAHTANCGGTAWPDLIPAPKDGSGNPCCPTKLGGTCKGTCKDNAECPAPQNPCQKSICDGGQCKVVDSDGASCDDGNKCTTGDICRGGTCVAGSEVVCTPLDQCHKTGTCDPATGTCSNPNKPDGTTCDDGNKCTTDDTCQRGECKGKPVECAAPGPCQKAGFCDAQTGTCQYTNKPDGTLCGADNLCTQDICQKGTCVKDVPKPDGTACSDDNSCTQSDACLGGKCVGSPVTCPPADVCHGPGTCDSSTGQCGPNPILPGTCFIGGTCYQAGDPNPDNPCQVCRPTVSQTGFSNQSNGTVCNDGNKCTVNDACYEGQCVGTPVTCTASDQCHVAGVCDPATGTCTNPDAPDGTACNDGNACTTGDTCLAGECKGTAVTCTASDQCHVAGTCDPATGQCSNPAAPDGTTCNDGNLCTVNDVCTGGTCAGTPNTCDDGDACTIDSCDPATGKCIHTPVVCPAGQTCVNGVCQGCAGGTCLTATQCNGNALCVCYETNAGGFCHKCQKCRTVPKCPGGQAQCDALGNGSVCSTTNCCNTAVCLQPCNGSTLSDCVSPPRAEVRTYEVASLGSDANAGAPAANEMGECDQTVCW